MLSIQDFLPPILERAIERYRRGRSVSAQRFSSYNEAASACSGYGYEQEELVRVVQAKTKVYREAVHAQKPPVADHAVTRILLALRLILNSVERGKPLNVIDFGGACGAHYFAAKAFFRGDIHFKWCVVETSAMAWRGREEFEDEELKFFDQLYLAKKGLSEIDLIFSSGSIMFVPEPCGLLGELVGSEARFLFLTRLALTCGDRDITCIQESRLRDNGPGPLPPGIQDGKAMYPITFVRKQSFESVIKSRYVVRLQFDEGAMYQVKNESISGFGYLAEKI